MSTNYAKYVGQKSTISGSVAATGVGSFPLIGFHDTYTILLSEALQWGNVVTVAGTLQPRLQLRARVNLPAQAAARNLRTFAHIQRNC